MRSKWKPRVLLGVVGNEILINWCLRKKVTLKDCKKLVVSLKSWIKTGTKIWSINNVIIKYGVNYRVKVYTGFKFFSLRLDELREGFNFAEFVPCRVQGMWVHKKTRKNKKK